MKNHSSHYIKNLLLPCLTFSVLTGVLSALLITAFQWAAARIIEISVRLYGAVRANPTWIPCLLLGAAALGLISALILSASRTCRGGGIPTSIAAIQGVIHFKWLASVLVLPFSALLSFLGGLPLGTEGPCVQMGTGVGDGVVRLFGRKKYVGWRRYMMTGGASAGFSLVTGAPISAILFSMEELHKRISPLLFSVVSISVVASQISSQILARFGFSSGGMFHIGALASLPMSLLFLPMILGSVCGGCSVLFAKIYHTVDRLVRVKLASISVKIKFPIIFVCVALTGFFVSEILGTGHALVEHVFERKIVWYVLIIVFLVRVIWMMVANTAGITGGIFLPTLAFGAVLGALCAEAFLALGVMGEEHYLLFVVLGMTAFLGANSRIPVTACVFAVEALSGANHIFAIIIAATVAFLIVELSGAHDFTDTVVEHKERAFHKGKEPHIVEVSLTVYENSFVAGKELRDILWPASCVVLSMDRDPSSKQKPTVGVGDVITVHYKTYDPIATAEEFEVLVGDQTEDIDRIMRLA